MARFLLKKFAKNSNRTGQFGSFEAQGGQVGDGTITSDPTVIQSLPAWENGWNDATNNALKLPRIEEMEGVQRVHNEMIYNVWIEGITVWQPNMPVIANQTIVQFQTGVMKPKLYLNTTGVNGEDDPEIDTINWNMIFDTNSLFVDIASQQTITGNKTFNGINTYTNYNAFWKTPYNIIIRSSSFDKDVTPTTNQFMGLEFRDKNDARVGYIGLVKDTGGIQSFEVQNLGNTDTIKISPKAEFYNLIDLRKNNTDKRTKSIDLGYEVGTIPTPSSDRFDGISYRDKDNKEYANTLVRVNAVGDISNSLWVKGVSQTAYVLGLFCNKEGTSCWTGAPTPPNNSNDTQIATTSWVQNKSSLVHQSSVVVPWQTGTQITTSGSTYTCLTNGRFSLITAVPTGRRLDVFVNNIQYGTIGGAGGGLTQVDGNVNIYCRKGDVIKLLAVNGTVTLDGTTHFEQLGDY